jgi:hypothetical protein
MTTSTSSGATPIARSSSRREPPAVRSVWPSGRSFSPTPVSPQRHLVAIVQFDAEPLPQHTRDDAEDGAGVLVVRAIAEDGEVEVAEAMPRGHDADSPE